MNATQADEITAYVEGVRRALTGLDAPTREELLEDLPEHLAEVQAEGTGTLVERLGAPEGYALELRASAGLIGGFPDPPPPDRLAGLYETRDNVLRLLGQADVRVGPVIGYEKASEFLVLLRPAWWVLRGYLVAMVLAVLVEGNWNEVGLLPRLSGNDLVGLVLLTGCVIVSIVLGRRSATLTRWPRYALWSGTAVLIIFAMSAFAAADSGTRNSAGYVDVNSYGEQHGFINDVFVYDRAGQLVEGARLYDQDGNPIMLGNPYCNDPVTGQTDRSRSLGYPFCPDLEPFGATPPALGPEPTPMSPSPEPTATTAAPPSASPSATTAAPPSASPSPSAAK